jgi:hypothetical protein
MFGSMPRHDIENIRMTQARKVELLDGRVSLLRRNWQDIA